MGKQIWLRGRNVCKVYTVIGSQFRKDLKLANNELQTIDEVDFYLDNTFELTLIYIINVKFNLINLRFSFFGYRFRF